MPHIGDVILDGITYDLVRGVVVAVIMTAAVQYLLGPVFHLLNKTKDAVQFGAAFFVLSLALVFLIGNRAPKPDLEAGISQALLGSPPTDERTTLVVLEVNILNKGHMQTSLKQWKVEATSNGSKYIGQFPTMPQRFLLITYQKPRTAFSRLR